jgi:hypothetical protein
MLPKILRMRLEAIDRFSLARAVLIAMEMCLAFSRHPGGSRDRRHPGLGSHQSTTLMGTLDPGSIQAARLARGEAKPDAASAEDAKSRESRPWNRSFSVL